VTAEIRWYDSFHITSKALHHGLANDRILAAAADEKHSIKVFSDQTGFF